MALERPEIPVPTNGSENNIPRHVTKPAGVGTRSDVGRDCRDAFVALAEIVNANSLGHADCFNLCPCCLHALQAEEIPTFGTHLPPLMARYLPYASLASAHEALLALLISYDRFVHGGVW